MGDPSILRTILKIGKQKRLGCVSLLKRHLSWIALKEKVFTTKRKDLVEPIQAELT
jgi:hypothetical protein